MPYHQTEHTRKRRSVMRNRLLTTARKLFVNHGYEATTMQLIVEEAGTSIGNCYFYFSNKQALFLTVLEELHESIVQAFDDVSELAPDGPGQLAVAMYDGNISKIPDAMEYERIRSVSKNHRRSFSNVG
ncbi:MAG: TetR/AcrR family transcriptional regulator [Chloroflexota bacterium]|nr:TetR/AcrR family transcriptional regulator [Chloroflexota bacterium]